MSNKTKRTTRAKRSVRAGIFAATLGVAGCFGAAATLADNPDNFAPSHGEAEFVAYSD